MKPKSYKNNEWQRMCNTWFIRPLKRHDLPVFILLVLVTAFLCVIAFPVAATVETQHIATVDLRYSRATSQRFSF